MREVGSKSEIGQARNGSFSLLITLSGLTIEEAALLSSELQVPVREVLVKVTTRGGQVGHTVVDATPRPAKKDTH